MLLQTARDHPDSGHLTRRLSGRCQITTAGAMACWVVQWWCGLLCVSCVGGRVLFHGTSVRLPRHDSWWRFRRSRCAMDHKRMCIDPVRSAKLVIERTSPHTK